jgi:hypothetical protein
MQQATGAKNIKAGHKLYLSSEYFAPELGDSPVLHKILENYTNYGVNESGYIWTFDLDRPKIYKDVQELWRLNWLYYACGSPVWLERVEFYEGALDHEKKTVVFASEDQEEAFYNNFGLEPDEQKRETQEKVIPQIEEKSVSSFYEKYKGSKCIYLPTKSTLDKIKVLVT